MIDAQCGRNEVETEVSMLQRLARLIPTETYFGDSNANAIEAQIAVLRERLSLDEVIAAYDDDDSECDNYTLSAAMTATKWLHKQGPAPSEDWIGLLDASNGLVN